jgi:hypothetical protein
MAAARHHFDRAADCVLDSVRLAGAELVNEVHVDHVVGMPKMQIFATRLSDREARGSHVGLSGNQVRDDFRDAVDGLDDQLDTEFVSEFPHEVELGARWPVRALDVADGAVARDDAQLTKLEGLVQERRRRRTGAE